MSFSQTIRTHLNFKKSNLTLLLTSLICFHLSAAEKDKQVYFGDTHGHSTLSSDAFGFGNNLMPDEGYKYARGDKVKHLNGELIQLTVPLDFYMMTDHAEMIGIASMATDPNNPIYNGIGKYLREENKQIGGAKFLYALQSASGSGQYPEGYTDSSVKNVWESIRKTADKYYEPGKFTTFAAFEWSSMPEGENLHRNVIFRDTQKTPDLPFSAMDSTVPEDLWTYLEEARAKGYDNLAIPHNGNLSNGRMFQLVDSYGRPIDKAYAKRRNENEPLFEIMQLKGTSETHPDFSEYDEFADFELLPYSLHSWKKVQQQKTGYVREAYKFGLRFQQTIGANPFKFGLQAGGDDHSTTHTWEEFNYHGGHASLDSSPLARLSGTIPLQGAAKHINLKVSAAGITGVWAEENTRDGIFEALKRKEAFATSGVRIKARFFGGWHYSEKTLKQENWSRVAYKQGVPMGGDLIANPNKASRTPKFIVHALRDPNSAPLQRIQIIKGWTEKGEMMEAIYDVVCSDNLKPDPETHRCPDNGAKVDLSNCEISKDKGNVELSAVWEDKNFNSALPAFYYVRVLENPVCRWSTRDSIKTNSPISEDVAATIQERAWTSPIWYTPTN